MGQNFGETPTVEDIVRDTILEGNSEDAFYVVDIQDILRKHKKWLLNMPRVQPFYAVKCNPSPIVLELLSALGIGFDCASKVYLSLSSMASWICLVTPSIYRVRSMQCSVLASLQLT